MAFPTDEDLANLEATHKRIGVVTHHDSKSWCVVLRKPTRAEYKRFRSWINQPQKSDIAQEQLFKDTVVFPAKGEIEALLDEWPGIPEACGKMLAELAGMSAVEQGKV